MDHIFKKEIKHKEKIKAALSYTGVISFLFLKDKSDFVRFHSKQARLIFIFGIFSLIIPVIGFVLIMPIMILSAIVGSFKALNGKVWKAPIVGIFVR